MSDHPPVVAAAAWEDAREALRKRGLRWTPQRRLLIEPREVLRQGETGLRWSPLGSLLFGVDATARLTKDA